MNEIVREQVENQLGLTTYWKQPKAAQAYREGAKMVWEFVNANPQLINPKLGLLIRGILYPSKQNYIDYDR